MKHAAECGSTSVPVYSRQLRSTRWAKCKAEQRYCYLKQHATVLFMLIDTHYMVHTMLVYWGKSTSKPPYIMQACECIIAGSPHDTCGAAAQTCQAARTKQILSVGVFNRLVA